MINLLISWGCHSGSIGQGGRGGPAGPGGSGGQVSQDGQGGQGGQDGQVVRWSGGQTKVWRLLTTK